MVPMQGIEPRSSARETDARATVLHGLRLAGPVGIEPTTARLTGERSAAELQPNRSPSSESNRLARLQIGCLPRKASKGRAGPVGPVGEGARDPGGGPERPLKRMGRRGVGRADVANFTTSRALTRDHMVRTRGIDHGFRASRTRRPRTPSACWSGWRESNPLRPGSEPGCPPLTYTQKWSHPLESNQDLLGFKQARRPHAPEWDVEGTACAPSSFLLFGYHRSPSAGRSSPVRFAPQTDRRSRPARTMLCPSRESNPQPTG